MTIAIITPGSWQAVVTTTADTVFQNQSPREVYLLVGPTAGEPLKAGLLIEPWKGVVIASGKDVSCSSFVSPASVFYMEV